MRKTRVLVIPGRSEGTLSLKRVIVFNDLLEQFSAQEFAEKLNAKEWPEPTASLEPLLVKELHIFGELQQPCVVEEVQDFALRAKCLTMGMDTKTERGWQSLMHVLYKYAGGITDE